MALDEQTIAETVALESPFLEATDSAGSAGSRGFVGSEEAFSPFAEVAGEAPLGEAEQMLAEALAELRDEGFDEALAYLAEETEQAVSERFTDETPSSQEDRERFAETYLSGVRFEAEQYLSALETGLAGLDVASLSEAQLEAKLDQFDPESAELTPAGEEFIGSLIKKAKSAVKFVAKTAKGVGKLAGSLLTPVLGKLKSLIRPLLRRVLALAIGRLPAALQGPARALASRFKLESETAAEFEGEEEDYEGGASPANLADTELLAEEFDALLADAFTPGSDAHRQEEYLAGDEHELDGRQLERLAEARGRLIDALSSGDQEAVGPAIEQFVPALLGALKVGINLVGRAKVVGFLAGYLAKLIGRWVGPQLSRPLSNAIVDTGLRLISLEAEDEQTLEAAPIALASVIEDAVRRFAEQEDYIFEQEDLTEIVAAEAFSQAVATHFPPQYVRADLRQDASLGGTFIARRPRTIRTYRKYSRVPEIEVTPQIANSLPSFGGTTLGATLAARGIALPVKARMHIYQAAPGTTLSAIARTDAGLAVGRGFGPATNFHPLTPAAAGMLLREPGLGVRVSPHFLLSPNRIAAGQRFYVLQPIGAGQPTGANARAARSAALRLARPLSQLSFDRRRGRITVRLYFAEPEAQRLAQQVRAGGGTGMLLQAIVNAYRALDQSGSTPVLREDEQLFEELLPAAHRSPARLRSSLWPKLRGWILPALAKWVGANAEAFVRAAQHPGSGVTVRIRLTGVRGLRRAVTRQGTIATAPSVSISVLPGRS